MLQLPVCCTTFLHNCRPNYEQPLINTATVQKLGLPTVVFTNMFTLTTALVDITLLSRSKTNRENQDDLFHHLLSNDSAIFTISTDQYQDAT